jgi:hypothetical protein
MLKTALAVALGVQPVLKALAFSVVLAFTMIGAM